MPSLNASNVRGITSSNTCGYCRIFSHRYSSLPTFNTSGRNTTLCGSINSVATPDWSFDGEEFPRGDVNTGVTPPTRSARCFGDRIAPRRPVVRVPNAHVPLRTRPCGNRSNTPKPPAIDIRRNVKLEELETPVLVNRHYPSRLNPRITPIYA
jgi:hypothetical protein